MKFFKTISLLSIVCVSLFSCQHLTQNEHEQAEQTSLYSEFTIADTTDLTFTPRTTTHEMSMYNDKYLLHIIMQKASIPKETYGRIVLIKSAVQDTVVDKTITMDTLDQKFWVFQENIKGIDLKQNYALQKISQPWVRSNNLYLNARLVSQEMGDTISAQLKIKYLGNKKNHLWVNVY